MRSALNLRGFFYDSFICKRVEEYEDRDKLQSSCEHVEDEHPFREVREETVVPGRTYEWIPTSNVASLP